MKSIKRLLLLTAVSLFIAVNYSNAACTPPKVYAGTNKFICKGTGTTLGAAPVTGHTYSWTSNPAGYTSTAAHPVVYPSTTTTYYLTETITATGCSATDSVTITVNPLPAANAGSNTDICNGQSATIGAAAVSGNTYSWVSGTFTSSSSNPTVTPANTKTYTLTETITATGCSASNSVTVTVHMLPSAYAGTNKSVCSGKGTTLGGAPISGHTYSWTSSPSGFTSTDAHPVVYPSTTTTYTLTEVKTSTGCTNTNSVTITVLSLPAANTGANKSVCSGQSTTIGATAVSGNTYSWSSSPSGFASTVSNPSTSPSVNTTYTLTETNTTTGCVNSNTVTVSIIALPAANVGSSAVTICNGSSVTLGGKPVGWNSYLWTSTGFTSTMSYITVSPTYGKKYTLTETDPSTGCSNKNSVYVTVNQPPAAYAGTSKSVCKGDGTTLGAAAMTGHTYSWTSSPGGFTSTSSQVNVYPTLTTVYTLTETITATGCSKTNSVTITVNPVPEAHTGPNKTICEGQQVTLGGKPVGNNTYLWTSTGFTSTLSQISVSPVYGKTYTLTVTNPSTGCSGSKSVMVTVNPKPAAYAGTNKSICNGDGTTLGSKAMTGHTYQWISDPRGFTSTVSHPVVYPTATTYYKLYETETATGCSNYNIVKIIVNEVPLANAGPDKTICEGQSTTLGTTSSNGGGTIGSNLKYEWTATGFTSTLKNPSVSPTAGTTYTLKVTNKNTGCFSTDKVVVTVNPKPAAYAGTDKSICFGSGTTLGAKPVSGNTYQWSSNPQGYSSTLGHPVVYPTMKTTYYLYEKNTSTGCSNYGHVTITINSLPTAVVGNDQTICDGSSTTIGGTAVSGMTYSWSSSPSGYSSTVSNPSVSPTITRTYILKATNTTNGCTGSDSVKVTVSPKPAAFAGGNKTICSGSSVTLGGAPVSGNIYSWTSTGFTSTSSTITVSPTAGKQYKLTETNVDGCTNSNTAYITVNQSPSAYAGVNKSVCAGGGTFLGATGVTGHTYSWTSSPSGFTSTDAHPLVYPSSTTTYTVTETTTSSGCSSSASITISVNPLPGVNTGSPVTICKGSSTTLGAAAVSGMSYVWTATGFTSTLSNPTVSPSAGTNYTLTVTNNSTACNNSGSVYVTVTALPTATVGPDKTISSGKSTTIGGTGVTGNSYAWTSNPSGFTSTLPKVTVSPTTTTVYTLTETNPSTGCSNTKSVTITIGPEPMLTAIDNMETSLEGIGIAPNPFAEQTVLNYSLSAEAHVTVELYDLTGKRIAVLSDARQAPDTYQITLDATHYQLKAGSYFVKFSADNVYITKQIIKLQ